MRFSLACEDTWSFFPAVFLSKYNEPKRPSAARGKRRFQGGVRV